MDATGLKAEGDLTAEGRVEADTMIRIRKAARWFPYEPTA